MALKINIETIPHSQQRYNTVGDWWYGADASWQFRISQMSDWRFEVAVAIHEVVECAICRFMGISQEKIDNFDTKYERRRSRGDCDAQHEPGDDYDAPYKTAHCIATGIERIVVAILGVSWQIYDNEVNSL